MKRFSRYCICWCCAWWVLPMVVSAETIYSVGIVPQQSAQRLAELWTPVLQHLSETSGVKLQFRTAKDIPEFEKNLAAGYYDFAYMNPYHFTVFNRNPGYRAVAVRKDQPIRGIIVVRKDSVITSLNQLANQTLAFPSPAAFAASVLPRAQLTREQIPFKAQYVSSHDSVYLNVAKGIFPAGGGVLRTLNSTPEAVREQLTVLWTTASYTPHAIAAAPHIDPEVVAKVQQALVDFHNTETGRQLLVSLQIKHQLIAAKDSDWDDVRGLGLDLLDQLINQ